MISRPVVVSPVKATLATRGLEASGLPASTPKPLTMLTTPGGSRSATRLIQKWMEAGVCSAGLRTTALPAASAGRQLPCGHQDREVPRDDLGDDAQRLVEVVRDGVVVELARASPPGRGARPRSSGSGRWRAGCRRPGSRVPACRSPSSRRPRALPDAPPSGRRSCRGRAARSAAEVRPQAGAAACAASRARSTSSAVPRAISVKGLPVDRARVLEVLAAGRRHVLAADPVVVAGLVRDDRAVGAGRCVTGHLCWPPGDGAARRWTALGARLGAGRCKEVAVSPALRSP